MYGAGAPLFAFTRFFFVFRFFSLAQISCVAPVKDRVFTPTVLPQIPLSVDGGLVSNPQGLWDPSYHTSDHLIIYYERRTKYANPIYVADC